MIKVHPVVLTAALFGGSAALVSGAGCFPAFDGTATYSAGSEVSATTTTETSVTESCTPPGVGACPASGFVTVTTITSETFNYECKSGFESAWCSQVGFEPDGVHSGSAWIREGAECNGTAIPAMTTIPAPWSGIGCPAAYALMRVYDAGDIVSRDMTTHTSVYQCAAAPVNLHCGQPGYEPGDSQFWEMAWTDLGSCNGTIAPTTSPSFDSFSDEGGCPSAYDNDAMYDEGDKVSRNGLVYECKAFPDSERCSQAGYEPGFSRGSGDAIVEYWRDAWTLKGFCEGTIVPTASPSFDVLADVGGCPEEWALVTYEEGDRVANGGMVFECKAFPMSGHCGQAGYEPDTDPSAPVFWKAAWTLLGHCSGTIAPSTSPTFDVLADLGGCPLEWAAQTYEEGDRVAADGLVFECTTWPMSGHCGQAGYEPGTNPATPDAWKDAWTVVGHCMGTIAPSTSPTFDVLANLGGCPLEWSAQPYEEGDRVAASSLVFECKADPMSRHCGQAGYEPDIDPATPDFWKAAWTVVGHCADTIVPTSSPTFDAMNSLGGCPDEWMRGSSTAYEEGDMVSVLVSTVPERKMAFRCKAWPYSGYCGQFSPAENGGEQGWTLAGNCDGSTGPTASPSFDALAVDASGCPSEWSASKTDYEGGDRVGYVVSTSPERKLVFECKAWPNTGYCNQGATFEPTTDFAGMAWTLLGACDGTITPTASPIMYGGTCTFDKCVINETIETNCVPGSAGCSCPAGFPASVDCQRIVSTEVCTPTDVDPWSDATQYVENDVVRVGLAQFRCMGWPEFLWCRNEAYRPELEDNDIWSQAWTKIEDCPP